MIKSSFALCTVLKQYPVQRFNQGRPCAQLAFFLNLCTCWIQENSITFPIIPVTTRTSYYLLGQIASHFSLWIKAVNPSSQLLNPSSNSPIRIPEKVENVFSLFFSVIKNFSQRFSGFSSPLQFESNYLITKDLIHIASNLPPNDTIYEILTSSLKSKEFVIISSTLAAIHDCDLSNLPPSLISKLLGLLLNLDSHLGTIFSSVKSSAISGKHLNRPFPSVLRKGLVGSPTPVAPNASPVSSIIDNFVSNSSSPASSSLSSTSSQNIFQKKIQNQHYHIVFHSKISFHLLFYSTLVQIAAQSTDVDQISNVFSSANSFLEILRKSCDNNPPMKLVKEMIKLSNHIAKLATIHKSIQVSITMIKETLNLCLSSSSSMLSPPKVFDPLSDENHQYVNLLIHLIKSLEDSPSQANVLKLRKSKMVEAVKEIFRTIEANIYLCYSEHKSRKPKNKSSNSGSQKSNASSTLASTKMNGTIQGSNSSNSNSLSQSENQNDQENIFSQDSLIPSELITAANGLRIVKKLVVELKSNWIFDKAVVLFSSFFQNPFTVLDMVIIQQFTSIIKIGDQKRRANIIALFLNAAVRNFGMSHYDKYLFSTLQQLADSIEPTEPSHSYLLSKFLPNILTLTTDITRLAQVDQTKFQHLGFLLPILSTLLHSHKKNAKITKIIQQWILSPDNKHAKSLRRLWIYLVIFQFVSPGVWQSEYFHATKQLSGFIPLFTFHDSQNSTWYTGLQNTLSLFKSILDSFAHTSSFAVPMIAANGSSNQASSSISDLHQALRKRLLDCFNTIPSSRRGNQTDPFAPPPKSLLISNVLQLDQPTTLYLLSLYHLETLRVESGSNFIAHSLFSYLEDDGLFANKLTSSCVLAIIYECFRKFLVKASSLPPNQDRQKLLSDTASFLAIHATSKSEMVRHIAGKFLITAFYRFPQISYSNQVISQLLTLLDTTNRMCSDLRPGAPLSNVFNFVKDSTGPTSPSPAVEQTQSSVYQTLSQQINVSENPVDLKRILNRLTLLSRRLINQCINQAPDATRAIMHHFLVSPYLKSGTYNSALTENSLSSMSPGHFFQHLGITLLLDLGSTTTSPNHQLLLESSNVPSRGQVGKSYFSYHPLSGRDEFLSSHSNTFLHILELKQFYLGQISGICNLLSSTLISRFVSVDSLTLDSIMYRKFTTQFKNVTSVVQWHETQFQLAAFIVWKINHHYSPYGSIPPRSTGLKVDPLLLRLLVWSPVMLWKSQLCFETAIKSWHWVLTSFNAQNFRSEALAFWALSRLFWKHITSLLGFEQQPYSLKLWLEFLHERFVIGSETDPIETVVIVSMIQTAFDPKITTQWGCSNNAFGSHFSLGFLALKLLNYPHLEDIIGAPLNVFRHNVILGILQWFRNPPTWISDRSQNILREEKTILLAVCTKLLSFKTILQNELISFKNDGGVGVPSSSNNSSNSGNYFGKQISNTPAKSKPHTNIPNLNERRPSVASYRILPDTPMPLTQFSKSLNQDVEFLVEMVNLLFTFCCDEIDRISIWHNPRGIVDVKIPGEDAFSLQKQTLVANQIDKLLNCSWKLDPRFAIWLQHRLTTNFLSSTKSFDSQRLSRLVQSQPWRALSVPEGVFSLVDRNTIQSNSPCLRWLLYWTPLPTPSLALRLFQPLNNQNFSPDLDFHPLVVAYVLRCLDAMENEVLYPIIPQLVQCLRSDRSGLVQDFLVRMTKEDVFFSHQVVWNCRAEIEFNPKIPKDIFPLLTKNLEKLVMKNLGAKGKEFFENEFKFCDDIKNVSAQLVHGDPNNRTIIQRELEKLTISGSPYLPVDPKCKVVSIYTKSGIPLSSASRVPIMITFKTYFSQQSVDSMGSHTDNQGDHATKTNNPRWGPQQVLVPTRCIFKVDDDVRQDALALQIIQLFKTRFKQVGLDLFLYPYRVIATGPNEGVIEVVKGAKSRSDLGKLTDGGLHQYFLKRYGPEDSSGFLTARLNFIKSLAAYAVVSYILQVKDRHNGNIMIDDDGHLIHIDFGFMLSISPGGEIKFERAPFKLSREMIDIMGGSQDSQWFQYFVDLCIRAFLAVQGIREEVLSLVWLMSDSGLPCYRAYTMSELNKRFFPNLPLQQVSLLMARKITESYDKLTTLTYDLYQKWTNGYEY